MSEKLKVDIQSAEAEFSRFVEAWDLDVDPRGMDDADKVSFESAKRRFVNAVCDGRLALNDKHEAVFNPSDGGETLTFHEPTGAALLASDTKKEGHNIGKMYATMAEVCRVDQKRFATMKSRDVKVCLAVMSLFLA